MCECGYTREQHLEGALRPYAFLSEEWDPKKHVQEMPTDAFGDIVFTGLGQKMGKVGSSRCSYCGPQPTVAVPQWLGLPGLGRGRLAETPQTEPSRPAEGGRMGLRVQTAQTLWSGPSHTC